MEIKGRIIDRRKLDESSIYIYRQRRIDSHSSRKFSDAIIACGMFS